MCVCVCVCVCGGCKLELTIHFTKLALKLKIFCKFLQWNEYELQCVKGKSLVVACVYNDVITCGSQNFHKLELKPLVINKYYRIKMASLYEVIKWFCRRLSYQSNKAF